MGGEEGGGGGGGVEERGGGGRRGGKSGGGRREGGEKERREKLRKEKIPFRIVNFVHDEIQCMVKDTEGLPEYTGQVFADAIVQAGKDLGVKCPQAGTWRTGYNWMETH